MGMGEYMDSPLQYGNGTFSFPSLSREGQGEFNPPAKAVG